MTELAPHVRALFERPNYAHVATVLPDGSPHSVAVWTAIEGGRIVFFTQPGSRKARNLERDPRVAISIVDGDNPYRGGHVRGRVGETIHGDAALEIIDRLALKYTGQPFPMRTGVVYVVDAERVGFRELPFSHDPGARDAPSR